MDSLSTLEFQRAVTLFDVTTVLQRIEMVLGLSTSLSATSSSWVPRAVGVQLQLEELLFNVREDEQLCWPTTCPTPRPSVLAEAEQALGALPSDELLSAGSVVRILGYGPGVEEARKTASPPSRLGCSAVPRLSRYAIEAMLLAQFGRTLQGIMNAPVEDLAAIDGVGVARAHDIKEGHPPA